MNAINKPWKVALIVLRSLLGFLFVFSGVAFFFDLMEKPELTGSIQTFTQGMEAAVYFLPLLKATEILCGLLLLSGRFVALGLVILAPISINIFMVHIFIEPNGIPVGTFVLISNLILAYAYRGKYKALFESK
jgi:uncharacterized membrane protein YphA (DoxX/SURF4 family)